jgi:glutamine synthetase
MAIETHSHPTKLLERFQLDHPKVSFIRFQWLDFAGVLRARVLLIESAIAMLVEGKHLETNELAVNFTVNHFLMPSRFDGSYRLVPDWSSLRLAVSPRNAIVMCALDYVTPDRPPSGDFCPRQALEGVLRQAREDWNIDFLVGFEVEFVVMKSNPSSDRRYQYSQGLGHFAVSGLRDPCYQYVEECVHQLQAQGVKFHSLHSEGHRGQYEIS